MATSGRYARLWRALRARKSGDSRLHDIGHEQNQRRKCVGHGKGILRKRYVSRVPDGIRSRLHVNRDSLISSQDSLDVLRNYVDFQIHFVARLELRKVCHFKRLGNDRDVEMIVG